MGCACCVTVVVYILPFNYFVITGANSFPPDRGILCRAAEFVLAAEFPGFLEFCRI